MSEETYVQQIKDIVLDSVDRAEYAVFLFGGRARGRKGRGVDVDVGILGSHPLSLETLSVIHERLEESTIPLEVDIVDFFGVEENFRKIAYSEVEVWNQPPTINLKELP